MNEKAPWRGRTALQWAALEGQVDMVKWLLTMPVDLEAKDETPHYRKTAWQLAEDHEVIRDLLKNAGAVCVEKPKELDLCYDEEGNLLPEYVKTKGDEKGDSSQD